MAVNSRNELSEYILRSLGKPVIEINVAEEQISDRIDDALEYFFEMHNEGSYRAFITHEITQQDIDNGYIDVPDSVYSIHQMYSGGVFESAGLFSAQHTIASDVILRGDFQIYDYHMMRSQLALLDQQLNSDQFRFVRVMNRVFINSDWFSTARIGEPLVFEGYKMVEDTHEKIYNNIWLKEYATQLVKKQWGSNLKKFTGMQLPGGVELDGKTIYEEAVEEIERLKEELGTKWSAPTGFLTG